MITPLCLSGGWWYKNAKRDGKITIDEIQEGAETLKEGLDGVKQTLEEKSKGDTK